LVLKIILIILFSSSALPSENEFKHLGLQEKLKLDFVHLSNDTSIY